MTPTRFGLSTMHRTSRTISRCFPGLPVLRLTVFFLAGCTAAPDAAAPGTTVFVNADIVTMNSALPTAAAVAVRDGTIVAVGSREEVEELSGPGAEVRDLAGKTIVPGFIDAHGHFTITGRMTAMANIQPPPAGPATSIADVQGALREWADENPEAPWILGWGYDDSLLSEGRHPNRFDLDEVSTDRPIALTHVSGHLMACNSICLELAGITAATPDPSGGAIHRLPGGTEPSGVVEETANGLVRAPIPATSEEEILGRIEGLQEYYASFGVTTVQDGGLDDSALALLSDAGAKGMLYLDIVGFRRVGAGGSIPTDFTISQEYDGHFRVGGIKMVLDGSPQGKTAWLTQPYRVPPHGQPPEYAGYPIFEFNQVYDVMSDAFERGVPVMAHANGDAAADQLIAAVTAANEAVGPGDRRTVMIHAQTAREDQLDQMKAEGIVPSYFVAHTFFWGDWHRDSVLGPERGVRISPLRSTLDRDMPFTIHNDTPVVPSDMMYLMWTAANRVTRSGRVLGNEQRLSGAEALHAVTLGAAYQFFEEGTKGSIEVGKVADFVVLSDNPTTVDRMEIKDIRIEETIKDGVTVFSAAASQE